VNHSKKLHTFNAKLTVKVPSTLAGHELIKLFNQEFPQFLSGFLCCWHSFELSEGEHTSTEFLSYVVEKMSVMIHDGFPLHSMDGFITVVVSGEDDVVGAASEEEMEERIGAAVYSYVVGLKNRVSKAI